ncbi:MAG: murein L,D-transpeptidase [Myxococcales bacterium]|nr:murein L,D-transpeptidase [Myxococcales bacterium]
MPRWMQEAPHPTSPAAPRRAARPLRFVRSAAIVASVFSALPLAWAVEVPGTAAPATIAANASPSAGDPGTADSAPAESPVPDVGPVSATAGAALAGKPMWPAAPFGAWVGLDTVYIRVKPRVPSNLQGVLRFGDTVTVTACLPDCAAPKAWALLAPWQGAVKLASLRPLPVAPQALGESSAARYVYGKVPRPKTPVFARPDARSKVLRKEKAEFRLAFVPDEALYTQGWLQRPDGGYMRLKDVPMFKPSKFEGFVNPPDRVAFVRRKLKLKGLPKKAEPILFQRYDRPEVLAVKGAKVFVAGTPAGTWLSKDFVRIAQRQRRPKEVKAGERWLHIDLGQQVLTTYEGDDLVFATLISAGKGDRRSTRTTDGVFRIYAKTIHSSMRGKPWDDYYAEEVPYVMHFKAGQALHGAYWHDQFGIAKSHGCVNLSPADARRVFEWMPPELPAGWHGVLPVSAKLPGVYLAIEKPGRKTRAKAQLAAWQPALPH